MGRSRGLNIAPVVINLFAIAAQPKPTISRCSYWLALARGYPAQFHHSMPDVPILRQMGRCNGLSTGNYHLVKRTTLLKFGIAIPAEFTNPARSGIEAYDDTALNMFHEEGSWGGENGCAWI
jgi:hypothetical protein